MLFVLVAPIWVAALSIAYIWGADPNGPWMQTGYVIAAFTSAFSILLSDW